MAWKTICEHVEMEMGPEQTLVDCLLHSVTVITYLQRSSVIYPRAAGSSRDKKTDSHSGCNG